MIRFQENSGGGHSGGGSAVAPTPGRDLPGAHRREVISGVVIAELERVLPPTSRRPLSPRSSLVAAGIDAGRLADAIARLEGRYVMRFCEEWLSEVRTCGDLVECVAERMFDAADRASDSVPAARLAAPGRPPRLPRPSTRRATPFPRWKRWNAGWRRSRLRGSPIPSGWPTRP